MKKGDSVDVDNMAIDAKQTKPPSRFTAATLLQAMKEIHKYVKNEDLKKQLKAVSGIGTEATRATIIDELITRKFMSDKRQKESNSTYIFGVYLGGCFTGGNALSR